MELNEQSKQVLKYANQIGKTLGASALDTQHLLYGLAKCNESLAGSILESHGVTPAAVKKCFESRSEALRKVTLMSQKKLQETQVPILSERSIFFMPS